MDLSFQIGVVCVNGMGGVLIIYHCIAHWPVSCGLWCLVCLGCSGVMLQRVLDLLTRWLRNLSQHRCFVVWRVVPHCEEDFSPEIVAF